MSVDAPQPQVSAIPRPKEIRSLPPQAPPTTTRETAAQADPAPQSPQLAQIAEILSQLHGMLTLVARLVEALTKSTNHHG
jgi:hypothetical protein